MRVLLDEHLPHTLRRHFEDSIVNGEFSETEKNSTNRFN